MTSHDDNVIEYDGKKFRSLGLIDYNSLVELLSLLCKKQKALEEKVKQIDSRTKNMKKDGPKKADEKQLTPQSQTKEKAEDKKFSSDKGKDDHSSSKEKENEKEKELNKESDIKDSKENQQFEKKDEKKYEKDEKKSDEKKDTEKKDEEKSEKSYEEKKDEEENDEDKKDEEENGEEKKSEKSKEEKKDEEGNDEEKKDKKKKDKEKKDEEKKDEEENDEEKNEEEENGEEGNDEEKKDEEENGEEGNDEQIKEIKQTKENGITETKKKQSSLNKPIQSEIFTDRTNSNNDNTTQYNAELISKICKKLKDHEKHINDLYKKNNEHNVFRKNIKKNTDNISDTNKRIDQLKQLIDDLNNRFINYEDEFDKIKVKVQDFNVYDLFQGSGEDGSLDASKILIMNLENKVFKKFGLYDERNKKLDKDFFKLQEDLKNALAQLDSLKINTQKNTEGLNDLNDNFNNKISDHENIMNDLKNQIDSIFNKLKAGPDFSGIKKDYEKKIKNSADEIIKRVEELEQRPIPEDFGGQNVGLSETDKAVIKETRKKINDLEKFVTNSFDKMNFEDFKKKILNLEKELPKKASKYEITETNERVKALDEFSKDLNFKVDNLQQFTEKIRTEMATIIKKIEYLSGEYAKLALKNMSKSDEGKNSSLIDLSKFVDIKTYNDNKKDVNNKFEKVRLGFEDLSREIEEILARLSHTPTDKDFSQYQAVIKNLLDEFKINCNKKYADKYETAKSIKFLETQIKTIIENNYKKFEGGDNWLLAKKPINSYCASCEAMIRGDLDKRTEFVAWNKYPTRDDKSYRLGHGFSRMLQMVNEDILKTGDKENKENKEKGYSSDEEKKLKKNLENSEKVEKQYNVNASVKLPKVNGRIMNIVTEPNTMSPYDDGDNSNNPNRPHIMKVFRKTKGVSPSPRPVNPNESLNKIYEKDDLKIVNDAERTMK